jgi:hypothetical protein
MSSRNKSTAMQTAEVSTSSNTCIKPNVIGSVFCLLGKHKWGGEDDNICQRCNKKAVGLPKFENLSQRLWRRCRCFVVVWHIIEY